MTLIQDTDFQVKRGRGYRLRAYDLKRLVQTPCEMEPNNKDVNRAG